MKKFLLKNLSRLLIVALVSGLTAVTSFAAVNTYTVSGGNPGALPNAGDASVALPLITITEDGAADDFLADPTTIQVLINTTNYDPVIFDDTVLFGNLTAGGTCGYNTVDSVLYDANGTYANVTVSGGTSCGAGETITIDGLKVWTKYAQAAPGANPLILVDNLQEQPGTPVASGSTVDLAVLVGDLTSTNVQPASLLVGQTSANTVSFTTTAAIPNLGHIKVTYPAGFDVSGANAVVATNLSGIDGTWTAAVAGQVITLTQTGGTATAVGAISFDIPTGIVNPTQTGAAGTYTILTEVVAGADIETDAAVASDNIVGGGGGGGSSVGTVKLSAPADFSVTVGEDLYPVLSWSNASAEYEAVQVIRSKGEGVDPSSIKATLFGDTETYIDENVNEGDIINYQLRPVDDTGRFGDMTEVITVTVEAGATTVVEEEVVEEEVVEEVVCEEGDTECEEAAAAAEEEMMEEEAAEEEMMEEAPEFSDIAEHWGEVEINGMAAEGIVDGNPDGTFEPNGNLNRAEASALLYRLLGYDEPTVPEMAPFPDVPVDMWYSGYVSNMKALEMIHGYGDGTYGPGNNITRAEFTKLALEAYYFIIDDEEIKATIDGWMEGEKTTAYLDLGDDWYTPYVTTAAGMGFTHGFACGNGRCFGAKDDITRAEATVMLYNIFYEHLTAEEVVEEVLEEAAMEEEMVEEEVVEEVV